MNMECINTEKDKIINPNEKKTFDEVIKCYEHSLYRAGYILTWILLIESIKRKLYELERGGDASASKLVKQIEAEEKAKKSTDKLIYESGKSCGLYDETEMSVIEYLWGRRCFFAHPYENQPTKTEFQYIIEQAIKIVLPKEVVYNKLRLNEVCEEIVRPHILNNDITEVNQYALSILNRTPILLYPFFFKSLLFIIKDYISTTDSWIVLRIRSLLVNIILDPAVDLSSDEWKFLDDRMKKFPEECIYGYIAAQIWDKLPMSVKDKAFNYLRTCTDLNNQLLLISRIFSTLDSEEKLVSKHKEILYTILQNGDIEKTHYFYRDKDRLIAVLEKIINGRQFIDQNKVIDLFKDQSQNWQDYSEDQQVKLGYLFYDASRMGCWKAISFVDHLSSLPTGELDPVKRGIALSVVLKSDGSIQKYFSDRLKILFKILLSVEDPKKIIDQIISSFNGKTSYDLLGKNTQNIQEIIDSVKDGNPYAEEVGKIFMGYYVVK